MCLFGQQAQTGQHVVGAERAVEPDTQDGSVLYADEEGLECLSAQQSALSVVDRDAEQERDVDGCLLGGLHEGVDGCLGVERVEDGLEQDAVHAAFQQGADLFHVGRLHLVVADGAEGRVADVGTHGERLVGRPYGSHHEARLRG